LQDIKEKQKKESSVDQQTEENEDKPTDSTMTKATRNLLEHLQYEFVLEFN
jgi:hypothetical protein